VGVRLVVVNALSSLYCTVTLGWATERRVGWSNLQ